MSDQTLVPAGYGETTELLGWSPVFGVAFLVAWLGCGLFTARVMGRRGHDARPLVALGLVFGPLLVPLVRDRARQLGGRDISLVVGGGTRLQGPVDVLVALLGPPWTALDAVSLLNELGPRLGLVTVTVPIDFDSVESDDWNDAKRMAALDLEIAAALLSPHCQPRTVIVGGRPLEALMRHARADGYHLLVVIGDHGSRVINAAEREDLHAVQVFSPRA
ncbi:MAG TPA: hypothetical protein VM282_27955 [Acidimicrobiales bacterium]|nr:hypothetical protein [Acidimicrobiales bacterium]